MDQQEKPAKFLYLPQAKNDHFIIGGADDRPDASVPGSEPEPGPEEPTGIYPCPCCGYLTFPAPKEEAIACICPGASGKTTCSTRGRTIPAMRTAA